MLTHRQTPHDQIKSHAGLSTLIKEIRENKIDPHLRDPNGNTLLHLAARYGMTSLILELLYAGAEINATNNHNESSLWLAAKYNHVAAAEILFTCGGSCDQAKQTGLKEKVHLSNADPADFWPKINALALRYLGTLRPRVEVMIGILFWQILHAQKNRRSLLFAMKPHFHTYIQPPDASGMQSEDLFIDRMSREIQNLADLALAENCIELASQLNTLISRSSASYLPETKITIFENRAYSIREIEKAFTSANYTLLFHLIKEQNPSSAFAKLTLMKNYSLALFWSIATSDIDEKDFYSLVVSAENHITSAHEEKEDYSGSIHTVLLNNIIKLCQGNYGLLFHIIDYIVESCDINLNRLNIFKHLKASSIDITMILSHALSDYTGKSEFQHLQFRREAHGLSLLNPPRNFDLQILANFSELFAINIVNIPRARTLPLPTALYAEILSFLDQKELDRIVTGSKNIFPELYQQIMFLKKSPETEVTNFIFHLENFGQSIQQFLHELENLYKNGMRLNLKTELMYPLYGLIYFSYQILSDVFAMFDVEKNWENIKSTSNSTCVQYDNGLADTYGIPDGFGTIIPKGCYDFYQLWKSYHNQLIDIFFEIFKQGIADLGVASCFLYISYQLYKFRPGAPRQNFAEKKISDSADIFRSLKMVQNAFSENRRIEDSKKIHGLTSSNLNEIKTIGEAESKKTSLEVDLKHVLSLHGKWSSHYLRHYTKSVVLDVKDSSINISSSSSSTAREDDSDSLRDDLRIPLLEDPEIKRLGI